MTSTASGPHPTSNPAKDHEPHPNPHALTHPDSNNGEVNYTPNPSASIKLSPEREKILKGITSLYSGSASEEDMRVYTENAIYDDPWSYCDNRYKIAGQWYGEFDFFDFRLGIERGGGGEGRG
jgi:hypothetical protein